MHYSGSRRVTTSRSYALSPRSGGSLRLLSSCSRAAVCERIDRCRSIPPLPPIRSPFVDFLFGNSPEIRKVARRGKEAHTEKFRRSARRRIEKARALSLSLPLSVASSTLLTTSSFERRHQDDSGMNVLVQIDAHFLIFFPTAESSFRDSRMCRQSPNSGMRGRIRNSSGSNFAATLCLRGRKLDW